MLSSRLYPGRLNLNFVGFLSYENRHLFRLPLQLLKKHYKNTIKEMVLLCPRPMQGGYLRQSLGLVSWFLSLLKMLDYILY